MRYERSNLGTRRKGVPGEFLINVTLSQKSLWHNSLRTYDLRLTRPREGRDTAIIHFDFGARLRFDAATVTFIKNSPGTPIRVSIIRSDSTIVLRAQTKDS